MAYCSFTTSDTGVAIMTIDNPPVNALSTIILNDLEETILQMLSDDRVRVIIITGAGRAFVAGADIREFTTISDGDHGSSFVKNGQDIFNLIENAEKPFIAAINGFALGGGLELALACHIRIADEKAMMGLPEIKLGIIPGYGGTQRAPLSIGRARATEMILTGDFIDAGQAFAWALINHIAPAGTVVAEAVKTAESIAARGRPAVTAALRAINAATPPASSAGLAREREEFGSLCMTENMKEGVTAFLEKRDPRPIDR